MKVTAVESIRLDEYPNIIWIQVHTDEGLVGLGETFMGAQAVEAYIHETIAPYLLGKDPLQIDRHARALYGYLGYRSTGVEMRGNSALDIALWDLLGKVTGQPIYQLLGGLSREELLGAISRRPQDSDPRSVDALVSRIRRKLGDGDAEGLIVTAPGFGYRLASAVQNLATIHPWKRSRVLRRTGIRQVKTA